MSSVIAHGGPADSGPGTALSEARTEDASADPLSEAQSFGQSQPVSLIAHAVPRATSCAGPVAPHASAWGDKQQLTAGCMRLEHRCVPVRTNMYLSSMQHPAWSQISAALQAPPRPAGSTAAPAHSAADDSALSSVDPEGETHNCHHRPSCHGLGVPSLLCKPRCNLGKFALPADPTRTAHSIDLRCLPLPNPPRLPRHSSKSG